MEEQEPNKLADSHAAQIVMKLKNMADKLEFMARPPGYPSLKLVAKILRRRR